MTAHVRTKRGRDLLPFSGNTEWENISPGVDIGFYKGKRKQSWKARLSTPKGLKRYASTVLGDGSLDFAAAQRLAMAWADSCRQDAAGGKVKQVTVGACCEAWLAEKRRTAGQRVSPKSLRNWKHYASSVENHFGADTPLREITAQKATGFAERPLKRGARERTAEGFNRVMAQLKAIMTHGANQLGYVGPRGWNKASKLTVGEIAHRKADSGEFTGIALTEAQMKLLLEHVDHPGLHRFIRAMFLTLQRPQALRMTDVRDFDPVARTLTLRRGKNATKKKEVLTIPLFEDAVELFSGLARGRAPTDPLIPALDGGRLAQDFQRTPFARAVKAAKLPAETTLYAVRRGAITHAAISGVDALTIAQMTDTSADLILQHYFKRTERLGRFADLSSADVVRLKAVS